MEQQNDRQRHTTQDMMRMLNKPEGIRLLDEDQSLRSCEELFTHQLRKYLRLKGLPTSELGTKAGLSRSFTYQILSGDRIPGRDIVIRLALVLHLTLDETQTLLRTAQRGQLYPRIRRDALIISAINQSLPLESLHETLLVHGEDGLL